MLKALGSVVTWQSKQEKINMDREPLGKVVPYTYDSVGDQKINRK